MTQKEEMGKKNLDEMERWHWPCWEGFIRLVCAAMGIPHSVLRAWEKLPSIPLALPGWAGLSSLSAGSSGHLCCPLPRGSTRGVISHTSKSSAPKCYIYQKITICITFGMGIPSLLPLSSSRPLAVSSEPGFAVECRPQQPPHCTRHPKQSPANSSDPQSSAQSSPSDLPKVTGAELATPHSPGGLTVSFSHSGTPQTCDTPWTPSTAPFPRRPLPNSPLLLPPLPLFPSAPQPIPSCPQHLKQH